MRAKIVRRALLALGPLLVAGALAGRTALAAVPPFGTPAPGETRLEARLIAPCCWAQTLDVHPSEPATALRREIRARLLAGETAEAIEDDLVARYGDRIRALPRGQEGGSPTVVAGLGILAAIAAVALIAMVRRWLRASAVPPPAPPAGVGKEDAYDRLLDDELRALDE